MQKSAKVALPNFGKYRKWQKLRFPTLGNAKISKSCASQLWEKQKMVKVALPNFGKCNKISKTTFLYMKKLKKWPKLKDL